nr:MAG TPA: hypothetical protein [Caudoviricetes sp.]
MYHFEKKVSEISGKAGNPGVFCFSRVSLGTRLRNLHIELVLLIQFPYKTSKQFPYKTSKQFPYRDSERMCSYLSL